MSGRYVLRGELFLSLEEVASCYHVELAWVREVVELGLVGRCERCEGALVVAATQLDRVAEILRLERQAGVNLAGIALLLGLEGPDEERG